MISLICFWSLSSAATSSDSALMLNTGFIIAPYLTASKLSSMNQSDVTTDFAGFRYSLT